MISSEEAQHQEIAARTVQELCRKFGDRIVGDFMGILKSRISSPDSRTREGVCLVLCEIMYAFLSTERHRDIELTFCS